MILDFNWWHPLTFVKNFLTFYGGGKGGGGSAPSPDPNIGKAEINMANLSQQEFNSWQTQVWPALQSAQQQQMQLATTQGQQQMALSQQVANQQEALATQQMDLGTQVANKQMGLMDTQQQMAQTYQDRMNNVFYPMQDSIVNQAKNFNTDAYYEQQAASALGDMNTSSANANRAQAMQMQATGVNPASGAYAGQQNANSIANAANSAAAMTRARQAAQQMGWAKQMDAVSLGSGLPGSQATAMSTASGAGSAAAGAGLGGYGAAGGSYNSALNAGGSGFNTALGMGSAYLGGASALGAGLNSGYGGAMAGYGALGNLGAQNYGLNLQGWNMQNQANAANSAGFGNLFGSVMGAAGNAGGFGALFASDRRMKKDIIFVARTPTGIPVYEFSYLWEPKVRRIGVMADEVEKIIPTAVTRGAMPFKMVDYAMVR